MKVHVFVRHTSHSHGKFRPDWFSSEDCFRNLLSTCGGDKDKSLDKDNSLDELTVVFDGDPTDHFVSKYPVKIVTFEGGTDAKSFINLLDYVLKQDIPDDDIVYLVEDDYIHRPNSLNVLKEVFQNSNVAYVSLYDHMDKYHPGYFNTYANGFPTQLFCTSTCHWKTTPSTTNSYAMRFSTLKRDKDIHYKYCNFGNVVQDHRKFLDLWSTGKSLVTPIPGYSTHVENGLLSPTIDWIKVLKETIDINERGISEDTHPSEA